MNETLELPAAEELAEGTPWDDPPPPRLEEQEFDVLAFELWQKASRQGLAADEDWPDTEEAVACHASCL